jgi:serine protease
MKSIPSLIALATLLSSTLALKPAIAGIRQLPADLSYRFYDTRINLTEKTDQVAVVFKPNRTRDLNAPPDHLKLQADLKGTSTRRTLESPPDLNVEVKPLGTQYAILTLPKTRSIDFSEKLKQRLEQSYIQTTLPVFQRKSDGSENTETIILNDEMLVTFEPRLSKAKMDQILDRSNTEIVRPLRFTENRYLVRSKDASGAKLFPVIDQLGSISGVQSASPNFISDRGPQTPNSGG